MAKASNGNQTIADGMGILIALGRLGGAGSLSRIAQEASVPQGKAHRHLAALIACGFVEQDGQTGMYEWGVSVLTLGLSAVRSLDPGGNIEQQLVGISMDFGASAFAVFCGPGGPRVLRCIPGLERTLTLREGGFLPLWTTAPGRLYLAYQSRPALNTLLQERPNEPRAENDLVSDANLRRVRKDAERDGLLLVEAGRGNYASMAAPVFSRRGPLFLILGVAGSSQLFAAGVGGQLGARVKSAAQAVGRNLVVPEG